MKKLLSLLTFFVALFATKPIDAQSTIFVRAPSYYTILPSFLPYEVFVQGYTNGCYLVTASELAALTGSNITSFGIHLFIGNVNGVANGTMSVYLQNTSDITYSKGNNFPSCISAMSNVYSGPTSIAATSGTADVICPLPSAFNYTGGGLYVAFSWSAGVSSSPISLYSFGSEATSFGVIKSQTSPITVNTMSTTTYRPTFVFGLSNTATNELGIDAILAPGKIAEGIHEAQVVRAEIRNISTNILTNVTVSLTISGSNSFSDSQIITSIAPGAVKTVSFAAYTPTAIGTNTLVVTLPPDQYAGNNISKKIQTLTCYSFGYGPQTNPYYTPISYQGILAGRFNFATAVTMPTVRLAISSSGINDVVHGVLLDQNGLVIARTNTVTITNTMISTFHAFNFTPPQVLQPNTNYYMGMAIPNSNLSTLGCVRTTDGSPGNLFGAFPLAGGTFTPFNRAYPGIEPILNGTIYVTPTTSMVCMGQEFLITPGGSSSYIWTNSSGNTVPGQSDGSLLIIPQSNQSYTVKATDAAGCAGQGSVSLKVMDCTSVKEVGAPDKLELFPNPTISGFTSLYGLENANSITVTNMLGQVVLSIASTEETVKIDMSRLSPGTYFVKIIDSTNCSKTIKLLHQE